MTQISINDKDYKIPTEWNELTAEQLLQVMDAIYLKQYEPVQLLLKLLKILMDIKFAPFFKILPEDAEEFLYLTSFLLQGQIGFSKNLIPVYERFAGPSDEIGNITGKEFVYSEHYHELWWNEKTNIQALNDFVATIYRPIKRHYDHARNPDGDCRFPFNENVSHWIADNIINKWPDNVKLAIATWYAGCRQKLVDDNPEVFGGGGEPAKYGLISLLRSIAEKGTYGTFDKVEQMPVSMMMIELNEAVEEAKKMEAAAKNTG